MRTGITQLGAYCPVLLLALVLQACAGADLPFSKSTKPAGRTAPPISIAQVNGLPQAKSQMLVELLQDAAAKRDIAIVAQDFPDSWKLAGQFAPQNAPDGTVKIVYGWTLQDGKARTLHQITGGEPAGAGSLSTSVTPDMLRRIADFTTESLSSRLAQMGFATQVAGLTPPTHTYARAGPGAEKELDYETLYGPGYASAETSPVQSGMVATAAPPSEADVVEPTPEPASNASKDVAENQPTDKLNAQAIRAVSVTNVRGAPGSGNRELTTAMRRVLKQAGWPVYSSPRKDALTISGNVDLGPPSGTVQKIALAWTVKTPGGKVLGTIKQANNVKAGSLDAGWGKTADYAAQAGAEGIFNLVKQLR